MYERFTDRAREIITLANQRAQKWHHDYLGTEHILLGILEEKSGIEIEVFGKYGVDVKKLRKTLEESMKSGPDMVIMGKIPQTPSAINSIEHAIEYARENNFNFIDSYHILAGLIRETEGIASQTLANFNFTEEKLTQGLEEKLGDEWPVKKTEQTEDKNQGYWIIPKSELDVRGFLKFYGFDFGDEDLTAVEKPAEMNVYLDGFSAIGILNRTSEVPLEYDRVILTPQKKDLEQLKKVAKLKQILDKHHVGYTSEPPIGEVITLLREDATRTSKEYNDIADSLEDKVE